MKCGSGISPSTRWLIHSSARNMSLFVFPALEIIRSSCVKQEHSDHQEENCLQSQKTNLHNSKPREQHANQSIKYRIAKIGQADALCLQDVARSHLLQRADLSLMPIFAGKRVIHERGAIGTESTLTVFTQANGWPVGMIITNQKLLSNYL